jgi:hypothetical protein
MTKEEHLDKIRLFMYKDNDNRRNRMGVSESYYNPYYLVGKFMQQEESYNAYKKQGLSHQEALEKAQTDQSQEWIFKKEEFELLSEEELDRLIRLAEFAGEVFY